MSTFDYITNTWWDENASSRYAYLIPGGPGHELSIVALYLTFVYIVGPAFMRNREPFKLTSAMSLYNIVNIVLNTGGFLYMMKWTNFTLMCWQCSTEPSEEQWTAIEGFILFFLWLKVSFLPHHCL